MPSKLNNIDHYKINISTKSDIQQLHNDWLDIESHSNVPFFLSWAWVSTWINTYNPKLYIVKALFKDKVVAIGLFTSSIERRHLVINAKQLRLNQTGSNSEDQIWVEYNDFICLNEHKEKAVNACLEYLLKSHVFYAHDEIIISMISQNRAKTLAKSIKHCEILYTRPCYDIDLLSIKNTHPDYIQSLKSNTRYQIRRSIRHYEKTHGEIELVHTKTREDALLFFKEIAPLHIDRWYDSGYKNKDFLDFHQSLIHRYFDKGHVHLIKVNSGNKTIAILYYLIKDKTVSFYLQGLLYETNKMLKPGLVAHSLATQYFIDQGMEVYDFMGGYSQYKTQLASQAEDLCTIRIQKPILKFIIENTAQSIKHILIRNKND